MFVEHVHRVGDARSMIATENVRILDPVHFFTSVATNTYQYSELINNVVTNESECF